MEQLELPFPVEPLPPLTIEQFVAMLEWSLRARKFGPKRHRRRRR